MTDAQIERLATYLQLGFDVWYRDEGARRRISRVGTISDPPGDPTEPVAFLDTGGYVALDPLPLNDIDISLPYKAVWPDDDAAATGGWMARFFEGSDHASS